MFDSFLFLSVPFSDSGGLLNSALQVRRLLPADVEAISNLYRQICDQAEFPIGPEWTTLQLAEECASGDGLILSLGTDLVAFVLFRDQVSAFEVTFLASAPLFRKKGMMRRLIVEVQSLAQTSGREIWLEVHEGNRPARQLYESLGFKKVGTRARYYPDGQAAILYNY